MGIAKVTVPTKVAESHTEPDPGGFAAYLIAAMQRAGVNNASLARLTAESHPDSPVDSSTISNLRTGKADPGLKVIRKIAPHLGLTVGAMLLAADPTLTAEELGLVAEPLLAEIADLRDLYNGLTVERERKAFRNHLKRSLTLFIETVEIVNESPREPRMRRK